jgi:putative transposase
LQYISALSDSVQNRPKRFKRVENATALIWKLLGVAEKQFRKLDARHQLEDVFEGRKFEDGKPVSDQQRKEAA